MPKPSVDKYEVGEKVFFFPRRQVVTIKEILADKNRVLIEYRTGNGEMEEQIVKVSTIDKVKTKRSLPIRVKYLNQDIPKLEKLGIGNWIDLRAAEDVEMKQFEHKLIPLGVAMQLPWGFEANIVPRSSTYTNFGVLQTNHYGVVDNSYNGDNDWWFFSALAMRDTVIQKGERICQFRITPIMPKVHLFEVETLNNESRGGFGSTGVK